MLKIKNIYFTKKIKYFIEGFVKKGQLSFMRKLTFSPRQNAHLLGNPSQVLALALNFALRGSPLTAVSMVTPARLEKQTRGPLQSSASEHRPVRSPRTSGAAARLRPRGSRRLRERGWEGLPPAGGRPLPKDPACELSVGTKCFPPLGRCSSNALQAE